MTFIKSIILSILVTIALSAASLAEDVKVLSGEHADFSRLVLQLPLGTEWTFGRTEGDYFFAPTDLDIQYDTREIFNRIPKSRIVKVEQADNGLIISTNPEFHADVFELRAGRVVIDIKDGPPQKTSEFERTILADSQRNPESDPVSSQTESTSSIIAQKNRDAEDSSLFPIVFGAAKENATQGLGQSISDPVSVQSLGDSPSNDELQVQELQAQFIDQISRAISQGMLTANTPTSDTSLDLLKNAKRTAPNSSVSQTAKQSPEPPTAPNVPQADRTHIQIKTSVDRETRPKEEKGTDAYGEVCLEAAQVDVSNWGMPLDEGFEIGKYRARALTEFDHPESDGVRDLVRYYIFLGFGAEAKAALKEFGAHLPENDILTALAETVDDGFSHTPSRLDEQFRCDGAVAFWSAMTAKAFSEDNEINDEAVLSTFSDLPLHLRRLLGPKLSEKYLGINDTQSAKFVQTAIRRVEGDHGDAFELLNAEIALEDGATETATEAFETIALNDGPLAPSALIRLIDTKSASGQNVEKKLVEFAAAAAVEHRDSELESELNRVAILGRINVPEPGRAIEMLIEKSSYQHWEPSVPNNLWTLAVGRLAKEAPDGEFLQTYFRFQAEISKAPLSIETRHFLFRRLSDLSFDKEALSFLTAKDYEQDPELRLAAAKSFLRIGQIERAEEMLVDLEIEGSADLRAKINFLKGDNFAAAEISTAHPEIENAETYQFLAERWNTLKSSENVTLSQAANILDHDTGQHLTPEKTIPTLAQVEAVLTSSANAREAVSSILSESSPNSLTQ